MKAARSGEKGTGKPEDGPLEEATFGAGARLAADDVVPTEAVIDAATDEGIPNKAAS